MLARFGGELAGVAVEAGIGGAESEAPGARGMGKQSEIATGEALGEFVGVGIEMGEELLPGGLQEMLDFVHILAPFPGR